MQDNKYLNGLINFRKQLHKSAELSDNEARTSALVLQRLKNADPDLIIENLGGFGLAAVYQGQEKGETILIRSELDALPIKEVNQFNYRSDNQADVSHKCGHDGHMAILAGFADHLKKNRLQKGRAVLLFQPSEEIGTGAKRVIEDEKFGNIKPDYSVAIHNLPGFEKGVVLSKGGVFASASKGIIIRLYGRTSHAAHPEEGLSPAVPMAGLIRELTFMPQRKDLCKDYFLVTVVHAKLGEAAFGTSPGYAEVMATLRSYRDEDMKLLTDEIEKYVSQTCHDSSLRFEISFADVFPSTENNTDLVHLLKEVTIKSGLKFEEIKVPFGWSDDFGYFSQISKGLYLGIGAGENHPRLHNADYDFPDDLISEGVNLLSELVPQILSNTSS